MTQLPFRPATELAAAIGDKENSSTELAECYLGRIEALNPGLGAVVMADAERARSEARQDDRRLARGEHAGPSYGLPVWASDCQSCNELFGTSSDPWDAWRTPGGSSGGAAAVAARLRALELGSDLGGSLLIPAAWCM